MKSSLWFPVLCAICFSCTAERSEPLLPVNSWKNARFAHDKHSTDYGIKCGACHHATNAVKLKDPHRKYFSDFWIKCNTCHHESKEAKGPRACRECHPANPANIADETLSAKVVIHKNCWQTDCHATSRGEEAGKNCKFCHTGV